MIEIVFETGFYMIGSIAVDAVVREVHHLAGEVTTHPVEKGSDISDHYRPAPRAVELEGVISDTPIHVPASHNNGAQYKQQTFDVPTELFGMRLGPIPISIPGLPMQGAVTSFSSPMDRVLSTWEEFKAIVNQRKVITIETSLDLYTDMVLTSLEATRRPGGSYQFNAFGQQITTVQSGRSRAAPVPKVKRAVPKVVKPAQPPTPVKDNNAALKEGQSALLGLSKGAGILD